ncbi:MAG TPA: erythromycin esterase family protein [Flavobacterium sp.]|nr:erythromycin esterase family protein [Flavobacterium sp.]
MKLLKITLLLSLFVIAKGYSQKNNENFLNINDIERLSKNESNGLKEMFKDKTVVMLGEPSHFDGAIFKAKIDLIKWLHENLGFDVILFESGFYDVNLGYKNSKNDSALQKEMSKVLLEFWKDSKELMELFKYVDKFKSTKNPIEIDGFDSQITSSYSLSIADDFDLALNEKKSIITKHKYYNRFKNNLKDFLTLEKEGAGFKQTAKDSLSIFLEFIANDLESSETKNGLRLAQTARSIESQIMTSSSIPYVMKQGIEFIANYNNIRDRQMAENIKWLIKNNYQGKKVIIWAANTHIARNLVDLKSSDDKAIYSGYTTMGDYLKKSFGEQLYALGFTASEGTIYGENNKPVELKVDKNSLEFSLSKTSSDYGILKPNQSLSGMSLYTFGYSPVKTQNKQLFDGIFYVRKMYLPIK